VRIQLSWTNWVLRDWSCLDFSTDVQHALIACVKRRISDGLWHAASAVAHCSSTTAFKSTAAVVISEPPTGDHSPSTWLPACRGHPHALPTLSSSRRPHSKNGLRRRRQLRQTALASISQRCGCITAATRPAGRLVEIISQVLLDGRRFAVNGDILNVSALIPLTDSRRDEWFARRCGFLSTRQSRLSDTSQESVGCMAWEN